MKKLNLVCPINNTGYGIASQNIFENLKKDYEVALFQPQHYPPLYDKSAPSLKIYHEWDCAFHPSRGFTSCLPIYELDTLPPGVVAGLNSNDLVFHCSAWSEEVAKKNGVKTNTKVVGLGTDTQIFSPLNIERASLYTFLNVGKWEIRKGHDVLIEVFNETFNNDDKVQLVLCCSNSFIDNDEWIKYVSQTKMGRAGKIKLVPHLPTQQDIARLMNSADCGVFPYRAEGWNLELLEMMACNKPVICTKYSGPTEFINDENSFSIEPDGMEKAFDGHWFSGQGCWAKLGKKYKKTLSEYMRNMYKEEKTGNVAGVETAKIFSWQRVVDKIKVEIP